MFLSMYLKKDDQLLHKSNLLIFLGTSNGSTKTCTSTDQKTKEQEKGVLIPTNSSSANRKMSDFSTQDVEKSTNSNAAKSLSHKKREQGRERALFILVCCITFTFFICHLPRYSSSFLRRPQKFDEISWFHVYNQQEEFVKLL